MLIYAYYLCINACINYLWEFPMNLKSINFDWNKIKAFLVVAEEGSFSAAAKILNSTQSTMGRQIAALEEELEIVLFERVGRGIELTPTGIELLEEVRKMASAANQISLVAAGKKTEIEGNICISASESTSIFILPKILEKIKKRFPNITVEIITDNKSNDLLRREADIAIRHYRPQSGELVIRKVRDDKGYLYASKKYLKQLGQIKNSKDLSKANFIGFTENNEYINTFKKLGVELTSANFATLSGNQILHYELIKNGVGLGVLPEYVGSKEKKIMKALEKMPSIPMETWLVVHRELNTSVKIRTVFDFLANEIQDFK